LIGKGIFLTTLVASDVFIIPLNAIRQIDPENILRSGRWYRPRSFLLTSAGIAAVVMLIYFSGMIFWVSDYKLNTVEIPVRNLPAAFNGYRVLQISDMHLGSFLNTKPLKKILNIVNAQNPDVILFTGDMVNFTTEEVYPFEEEMKQFSARDGIYSILGNHDYGEYSQWDSQEAKDFNDKALFDFYKNIGWRLLRNEHVIIRKDTSSIAILGVENWSVTKRFGKKGDLKKAISGTESSPFKILMTHDPSHWDGEVNTLYPQIGLTLSGHTHAFQLALETGSIKWSPASLLFKEWAGLYEKVNKNGDRQYLYVNRGAGTLGYPGRILARPEITLLILNTAN
jgi:predicted MPP superfamily phosphohydrolase